MFEPLTHETSVVQHNHKQQIVYMIIKLRTLGYLTATIRVVWQGREQVLTRVFSPQDQLQCSALSRSLKI